MKKFIKDNIYTENGVMKDKITRMVVSGLLIDYYENIREESQVNAGLIHGTTRFFDSNDNLMQELQNNEGVFCGVVKFYRNGILYRKDLWKTGLTLNDPFSGKKELYYASGKLKETYMYKNELMDGPFIAYSESGWKILEVLLKGGENTGGYKYTDGMGGGKIELDYEELEYMGFKLAKDFHSKGRTINHL